MRPGLLDRRLIASTAAALGLALYGVAIGGDAAARTTTSSGAGRDATPSNRTPSTSSDAIASVSSVDSSTQAHADRAPAALRRRALAFVMVCLGASLGGAGASAESAAPPPSANGRIAFVSAWAENLASEVYRVDVASGRRTNLSRYPGYDYGAVVSPDGRTVLFMRVQDLGPSIWAMNADGREQRLLVEGGAAPAWSPDGSRVAFSRDDELLTMAADGQDVRPLARGHSPSWSPDSRMLAWIDGSSVFVGSADGSGARRLYSTTALFSAPTWSPDGTQVAVAAEVLVASGTGVFHGLVTIPVTGGEARRLASLRLRSESTHVDTAWSSDGRRIAYVSGRQIVAARVDDGTAVALTRPPQAFGDTRPAWSPDGRFLVFARGTPTSTQLYVVPAAGGKARQITHEDVHSSLGDPDLVVWTPDGRSVVYSNRMEGNDSDVYTVNQDGTGRRRMTTNDVHDSSPAFSPDGRWIAFVRTLRPSSNTWNEELFLMRADGSGARRLTHRPGPDIAPAWSPDGSRIVFVRSRTSSLYTLRPDGTGLTRLRTPHAYAVDNPTWSSDGHSIAFSTWSGDCEEEDAGPLLALRTRSGRLDKLVDLGQDQDGAWSPEWSPDGKAISFLRRPYACGRFDVPDPGLWTVRPDGSAAKLLLEGVFDAAWSPDGRHFIVLRNDLDLDVVSRNGSLERELAAARGVGWPGLSWQPLCTLTGGPRADRLRAGASSVRACGLGGDDTIRGGRGADRLFGAEGDDTIDARGGGFDVVGCGPGRDRVGADRRDLVGVDCEQVTRR